MSKRQGQDGISSKNNEADGDYFKVEATALSADSPYRLVGGNGADFTMANRLLRALSVRGLTPRSIRSYAYPRFRHTFGTDMARAGVQLPVIQRMMGHADSQTTLQYIELSMADIAADFYKAMEKLKKRYDHPG